MHSPIPTVIMVLIYLYVVIFLGPRVMANKKPFKLREILIGYNGFQVLFSLYMLYEVSYSKMRFGYGKRKIINITLV